MEAVLIAGSAYGQQSPVKVFAPMFLLEVQLTAGTELALPQEHVERGVFVVDGAIRWGELDLAAEQMAVQTGPTAPSLRAHSASRLLLFGGAPLDGERHLWWNFVASSKERIEQAKADWQAQRMGKVVGDEDEFIPLP
jgi:redox-sensitive bicupin YhaK (pirin superfamily)